MKKIYVAMNERLINKVAKRLLNHPKGDYEKSVRDGVKARGGDVEYVENILKEELECINNLPYETMVEANPKRFQKYFDAETWASETLQILPNGLYEHAYVGKVLAEYKDNNGLLDYDNIHKTIVTPNPKNEEKMLEIAKGYIFDDHKIEVELIRDEGLEQYFDNVKTVYTCKESKSIYALFEFRDYLYDPKRAHLRIDSWKYNSKFFIEDEHVLSTQMGKIKKLKENLNVPKSNDVGEYIKWLNSDVTIDDISKLLKLCTSISIKGLQYRKEVITKIKNSEKYDKYSDYEICTICATIDAFNEKALYETSGRTKISHDYDNDDKYKELYG